jgi:hypothetical protein
MKFPLLVMASVLFAGCSSSTAPGSGDPVTGTWSVTLPRFADSSYFAPSPFTLTVASNGGTHTASYSDLVYHMGGGAVVATYTAANDSSSFVSSGSTLTLRVGTPTAQCVLTIQGSVSAGTATGTASLRYGCGPSPVESVSWTAVKQ